MEKLVPKLRFPEFQNNETIAYRKYGFNDIFNFSTGKNIKQSEASPEFEIPCVRYGELYHMYNEVIYNVINKTNLEKSELIFSNGDEILLPSAGEDPLDIGSASALTIENIAIGRTINILSPKNKNIYSPIYVSYYINQKLKKKIASLAKGVSISNVYNSDLKTLNIKLPSFEEQQKIASFLTSVDERLTLLAQQKEKLELYKKGVMQQIFSQKLRFKDENGNYYPDWEEKKIKEIFEVTRGYVLSVGKMKQVSDEKNIYPVYSSQTKNFGLTGYYHEYLYENSLTWTTDGANAGDVNFRRGKFYCTNVCGVLISKEGFANEFTAAFLNSVTKKYVSYVGNPKLMNNTMAEIKIKFPCLEEQQKIASFLSAIDVQIEGVSKKIEQTKMFKKGLLQQLFV